MPLSRAVLDETLDWIFSPLSDMCAAFSAAEVASPEQKRKAARAVDLLAGLVAIRAGLPPMQGVPHGLRGSPDVCVQLEMRRVMTRTVNSAVELVKTKTVVLALRTHRSIPVSMLHARLPWAIAPSPTIVPGACVVELAEKLTSAVGSVGAAAGIVLSASSASRYAEETPDALTTVTAFRADPPHQHVTRSLPLPSFSLRSELPALVDSGATTLVLELGEANVTTPPPPPPDVSVAIGSGAAGRVVHPADAIARSEERFAVLLRLMEQATSFDAALALKIWKLVMALPTHAALEERVKDSAAHGGRFDWSWLSAFDRNPSPSTTAYRLQIVAVHLASGGDEPLLVADAQVSVFVYRYVTFHANPAH